MAPPPPKVARAHGILSRGGGRPPGPIDKGALEAQMAFVQRFRLPQRITLHITLFRTDVSKVADAQDFVGEQIAAARASLDAHNISLETHPADGVPTPLPFNGLVIDQVQINEMRTQANNAVFLAGSFPVIYCPFADNYQEVKGGGDLILGQKFGGTEKVNGVEWLPFAIINVRKKAKSGMTLLHEMGHGAGLGHFAGDADTSNFMYLTDTDGPLERRGILCCQAMAFAGCYFAQPKLMPTPAFKKRCPISEPCRRVFGERWTP